MTRKRIEIKKINNIAARQVTFSKRRRGLFKKAQELSTLCDAELALIIFSATNKLFEYASSSVEQVIERHEMHTENPQRVDQPYIKFQNDINNYTKLSKEVTLKTRELRQLHGEELQELTFDDLQMVEKLLEVGLTRVSEAKNERLRREIKALKKKSVKLMEDNKLLKQVPISTPAPLHKKGQSFGSLVDDATQDRAGNSDTSLKLGVW